MEGNEPQEQKLYWIRADNGTTGTVSVGEIINCINRDTGFHEDYYIYTSEKERETHAEILKSLAQGEGK